MRNRFLVFLPVVTCTLMLSPSLPGQAPGAPQRAVLDATAIGHLTPPEQTQQGIEMIAVCARDKTGGDTVGMAQTREAMVAERYNAQAKRYLEQLRREAIIETPN